MMGLWCRKIVVLGSFALRLGRPLKFYWDLYEPMVLANIRFVVSRERMRWTLPYSLLTSMKTCWDRPEASVLTSLNLVYLAHHGPGIFERGRSLDAMKPTQKRSLITTTVRSMKP